MNTRRRCILAIAVLFISINAYTVELPTAHDMDEVSRVLLGEGQMPWERVPMRDVYYGQTLGRYVKDLKGIRARAHTLEIVKEADGAEVLFVAIEACVIRGDNPPDSWEQTIMTGVVRKRGESYECIHSVEPVHAPTNAREIGWFDGGYFAVGSLTLGKEKYPVLVYVYGDSISTPRGVYRIQVTYELDDAYQWKTSRSVVIDEKHSPVIP